MTTYKLKNQAVAVLVVMLPLSFVGQTSKHKTPSPLEIAKNSMPLHLSETASLAMKTKAAAIAATASTASTAATASSASASTTKAPAVIPSAVASITVEGRSADEILQADTVIALQATSAEMQAAPGTYNDIPRFLMTEPGVTFDTDSRNTYMVNGGNPIENLYVVDGVEVANINHLSTSNSSGGFVSMLDTDAVSSVSLHKALYSTKYTGALSSVLSVNTAAPGAQKRHLQMDMGYAGMGAIYSHPVGKKAAFLTQYRRSVINYFTDDIGIGGAPIYSGTLARVDTHPTGKDTVFGLYIGGNDKIAIRPNLLDNEDPGYVRTTYTGNRGIYAATWNHIVSGSTLLTSQVSYASSHTTTSQVNAMQNNAPVYSDDLKEGLSNGRFEWLSDRRNYKMLLGTTFGVRQLDYTINQAKGFPSPYNVSPLPVNASDIQFNGNPMDQAAYGQFTWKKFRKLEATLGARMQRFGLSGATAVSPQASVMVQLTKGVRFFGGVANYSQQVPLPTMLGIASNRTLKPISDVQYQATVVYETERGDRLSIGGYHKVYSMYPVSVEHPTLSLANIVDTFGQPFLYMPMVSKGSGISNGVEVEFNSSFNRKLFVRTNVGLGRSFATALDGVSRRTNYDMPLRTNLIAGVRMGKKQIFTTRYSSHTGTPYTPYLVRQSQLQQRPIYDVTSVNTARGTDYQRVDVHYELNLQKEGRGMKLYGGLDNVLNNRNYYQYVMIPHCPGCGPYELTQMNRYPEFGITWAF